MTGTELVALERQRQIEMGFTPEHDDTHTDGSLALCAWGILGQVTFHQDAWDDDESWWTERADHVAQKYDTDSLKPLIIAAALLTAEIERRQRTMPAT